MSNEHVVSLHLEGTEIIEGAYCEPCREQSNKYESRVMYADLLVLRLLLELKRARRKKRRGPPPRLPPVALGDHTLRSDRDAFVLEAELSSYPPVLQLTDLEPAGFLVGENRGSELRRFRFCVVQQPLRRQWVSPPGGVTSRVKHDHTALAMTIAKIGYCHAVAELGLDGFDGVAIRDLLWDRREDVYNFVGGRVSGLLPASRYLHRLYLRRRSATGAAVVGVHLFAAFQMPVYEVAVEGRG